jgi:hypothetical protein
MFQKMRDAMIFFGFIFPTGSDAENTRYSLNARHRRQNNLELARQSGSFNNFHLFLPPRIFLSKNKNSLPKG